MESEIYSFEISLNTASFISFQESIIMRFAEWLVLHEQMSS